jgi:hypothetical protein
MAKGTRRVSSAAPPPSGSKADLLWVLAKIARKAGGLPYGLQVLAEIKKKLGTFPNKKAEDLTEDEVTQILDAADRYVADPENRVNSMGEASAYRPGTNQRRRGTKTM